MKLTNEQTSSLLNEGYVELPQISAEKVEFKMSLAKNYNKTYSENTKLNRSFLESFNFKELKSQLSEIAASKFNINVDKEDVYTVTRLLKSYDNLESYRGHFDSHLFTIVTPLSIPKSNSSESGQLIVFPKVRKEPKNELSNIYGKVKFKFLYDNKKGFEKLMNIKSHKEFSFNNLTPILFLGRQCFHGNRAFDKAPNGTRLTLLTHLFDPNKNGIGAFLRKIRNR